MSLSGHLKDPTILIAHLFSLIPLLFRPKVLPNLFGAAWEKKLQKILFISYLQTVTAQLSEL